MNYKNIKNEFSSGELKKVGERLRDLRIKKGYSNYETFAFDNGIPRSQYGRYEKGSDLRLSSLIKILKVMEISLEDFFEGFTDN